ncbi:MAG: hypothetical protein ACI4SL_00860 [Candidatus Ornithospirochaeta sp.]
MKEIFFDDFSSFPLGPFPYDRDHSAMGEYHFYPEKGYKGQWFDPIADFDYRGPSWLVTSPGLNGVKCMEQQRMKPPKERKAVPVLRGGEVDWRDYTLTVVLRPFISTEICGVLFRYQTSMMYYGFFLKNEGVEIHRVNKTERTVLASLPFAWSTDVPHTLKVVCRKNEFSFYVDGAYITTLSDDLYSNGCIALSSSMPTEYYSVSVEMDDEEYNEYQKEKEEKRKRIEEKRKRLPQMKLLRKISLHPFGAGRQIRFGHLTGTDELFFLMAQNQRRVYKDRYPFISALTAVSLDTGKILWQKGEAVDDDEVIELTTDLPMQIYDIDGDGIDEVITSYDFKILILDGRDGSVKKSIPTPLNEEKEESVTGLEFGRYAFSRLNVDAIRIVNVRGNDRPRDIMVKDRYARLWIYDDSLNLLWKFSKYNTGHFPFNLDIDGDGKDEIFSCYNLVDHDGKLIWSLPIETDHTDEIIYGKFSPEGEECFAIVSGWEGFMLVNKEGKILLRDINGHGQRISAGNYLPDNKGIEICTTTYWGNNGIIYMHDGMGREIWHKEALSNGNMIAPVNWDGSGVDLLLLNADVKEGGLMDGEGDVVVPFPDDGHPTLSCEVIKTDDDPREKIVVWDRKEMYIYTQDRPMEEREEVYDPIKYEEYNASNYRGEYSFPRWRRK